MVSALTVGCLMLSATATHSYWYLEGITEGII